MFLMVCIKYHLKHSDPIKNYYYYSLGAVREWSDRFDQTADSFEMISSSSD